jgi:hypothetical protein
MNYSSRTNNCFGRSQCRVIIYIYLLYIGLFNGYDMELPSVS